MAGDVAAVPDACGFDPVDVVGNSRGGGVAVHLARLQPGRARRLMLCEPIVLPIGPGLGLVSTAQPLAAAALRRKVVWPSREAMIQSYGSRPPMARLAPAALAAYVGWGPPDPTDGPVSPACPPASDAAKPARGRWRSAGPGSRRACGPAACPARRPWRRGSGWRGRSRRGASAARGP